MWKLIGALFLFAVTVSAEDTLASQPGIAVPPNVWTQVCPGAGCNGFQVDAEGYDALNYNPIIKKHCFIGRHHTLGTEQNNAFWCYSMAENRWSVYEMLGSLHNEHTIYAGHGDAHGQFDPMGGQFYIVNSEGSGAQTSESSRLTWIYDPIGMAGRVKDQVTKPLFFGTEHQTAFDYIRGVLIQNNPTGTADYGWATNTWGSLYSSVGQPPTNLGEACAVFNSNDQSMYVIGGGSAGSGGLNAVNTVYKTHAGAPWQALNPGVMSARAWPACAHNPHDNTILVVGGCVSPNCYTAAGQMTDMWLYDAGANTMTLLPQTMSVARNQAFLKLSYDPEFDAYVYVLPPSNLGVYQTWIFRRSAGQKIGSTVVPASRYSVPLGLNRNGVTAWGKDVSMAAAGASLAVGWAETSQATDTGSLATFLHPYSMDLLPTPSNLGSAYNSMMPLISGASSLSNDISMAWVGGVRWACWTAYNNANLPQRIYCAGWDGAGWNYGGAIVKGSNGAVDNEAQVVIADVAGVPTIAFTDETKTGFVPPEKRLLYVEQCTGGGAGGAGCTWQAPLSGGPINRTQNDSTHWPRTDRMAITSDGTFPVIAWTEFNAASSTVSDTRALAYVSRWNGTSFVQMGGSSGINPDLSNNPSGSSIAITWLGGQPYVALIQRTDVLALQRLYLLTTPDGGTTWNMVAAGSATCSLAANCYLNVDRNNGYAFFVRMTDDGTNLYFTWSEQANFAPWISTPSPIGTVSAYGEPVRVFVDMVTPGGVVTRLGGALNQDPIYGSATTPSITIHLGQPAVGFAEVQMGSMRQVYARKWNGSYWDSISTTLSIATQSLAPWTVNVAGYSQTLQATGGTPPYSWALTSGTLPTGLSLASGVIQGTPTVASFPTVGLTVTDSTPTSISGTFVLTVNPANAIQTLSLPPGTTGAAYSQGLISIGGTSPYIWSMASGTLPVGLTLLTSGTISGTPQSAGTSNFTVKITDSVGGTNVHAESITVNSNLSISSGPTLPNGTLGVSYSQQLTSTGGFGACAWSVSAGTAPSALTLSSGGLLSGIPGVTGGPFGFTVQCLDAGGNIATKALALTINPNGALQSGTTQNGISQTGLTFN